MPTLLDEAPLIVTAHLDARSFAVLDGLRQRHFPAALNKVPAHVSLFHHLPGQQLGEVTAIIADVCATERQFALWPLGPISLGRGVALRYESEALARMHATLARRFAPWLTAQDRQRYRAHVTIQNKVTAAEARALLQSLTPDAATVCTVEGLTLWSYRGGPWEHLTTTGLAGA